MFEGFSKDQVLSIDTNTKNPARDDNSYFSIEPNGAPTKLDYSPKVKSKWNPNESNYGYSLLDAYNNDKTDTLTFCKKSYGVVTGTQEEFKYITDSEFSNWIKISYETPFLKHIDFSDVKQENNDEKDINSFSIVKKEVYKNEECIHTVIYVK